MWRIKFAALTGQVIDRPMIKYITVPKSFWVEDPKEWTRSEISPKTMAVFEEERCHRNTGILDVRGNPIVAVDEPNDIGFGRK